MGRILIACRQGLNQIERSFNASGGKRFEANRPKPFISASVRMMFLSWGARWGSAPIPR